MQRGVDAARQHLLSIQREDGHWCGELEGDSILESEYAMLMHYLGRGGDAKVVKAANGIRAAQLPGGGWSIYPGGDPDVSASVKAYFVLKLVGDPADAEHMRRARRAILERGGIEACNSFTKIYLAVFGQYDWDRCPSVPPELMLFPRWFYVNVYEMSSWSRAILIPLSVVSALRPHCPVPDRARLDELVSEAYRPPERSFWFLLFQALDTGLKMYDRLPIKPPRGLALRRAKQWIIEHLQDSDGIGAIFPPIVNTIYALHAMGYAEDDPVIAGQVAELEKLEIEDGDTLRVQPCFSPVWDTALAANALAISGLPKNDPALQRAALWMLDKRGHAAGDWSVKNGHRAPAGWFFEYANPYYPDCDTTAQVIIALHRIELDGEEGRRLRRALFEAHEWHLGMQNKDGGWGAFDRGCDKEILTHVPFADHNAMIDPSTVDLTARALEMLAGVGYTLEHPPLRRAVDYVLDQQEADGCWFGRWGCNYVYGTWLALVGLRAAGVEMDAPFARRAVAWLAGCQNDDGGWGELPASYDDPGHRGRGPSTASQTAWAVLGLLAAGEGGSDVVRRGVEYLLREQHVDGSWSERYWTGTGFPSVFYLRYQLYPIYFPLQALAEYAASVRRRGRPAPETARREEEGVPA